MGAPPLASLRDPPKATLRSHTTKGRGRAYLLRLLPFMPYRLQPDEALSSGLQRIAEEQINAAITHLQAGLNVHQARKGLKKARAVLNLLKPQLGPLCVEENHRLRDVGASLRCFARRRRISGSVGKIRKPLQTEEHAQSSPPSIIRAESRSEPANGLESATESGFGCPYWNSQAHGRLASARCHARIA